MLIFRMVSGLVAQALWLLKAAGGRQKKNRAASQGGLIGKCPSSATDHFGCSFTEQTSSTDAFCQRPTNDIERLRKAAAFHSTAARKCVLTADGEGVLQHMRHFRRYSSSLIAAGEQLESSGGIRRSRCPRCGSTCRRRDMDLAESVCFACIKGSAPASWISQDGCSHTMDDMGDSHLVNCARLVTRWLRTHVHPVSDDRIRQTGHVLVECERRRILGEVRDV